MQILKNLGKKQEPRELNTIAFYVSGLWSYLPPLTKPGFSFSAHNGQNDRICTCPPPQKNPPAINVNFYPSPAHSTQRRYPEINLCPTEAREGKKSEVVTDKSRA